MYFGIRSTQIFFSSKPWNPKSCSKKHNQYEIRQLKISIKLSQTLSFTNFQLVVKNANRKKNCSRSIIFSLLWNFSALKHFQPFLLPNIQQLQRLFRSHLQIWSTKIIFELKRLRNGNVFGADKCIWQSIGFVSS